MVYVLSKSGNPLMPTKRYGWVRRALKERRIKVVRRFPFTIQLTFDANENLQPLTMGVDTGFKNVGASVVSSKEEVFSCEAKLRTDVSDKVSTRRMYRRTRRGNKLRYRQARFSNRKRKVLQPSVKHKIESHERLVSLVKNILPISEVVIEANNFDMAKMKNPDIKGREYQEGDQLGYYNIKQYVLARDSYKCQAKASACVDKLHVHHIVFRSNGGSNAPSNLITLCEKHHDQLHKGKLELKVGKHKSLKTATMMNVIRSQLLRRNPECSEAFGYETKFFREKVGLEKSHSNDAFIIAGGRGQSKLEAVMVGQKRKNNRSIQLNRKGFKPSIRRQRYDVQPKDIVSFNGVRASAIGVQNYGKYVKFRMGGKDFVKAIKHIKIVFHQKGFLPSILDGVANIPSLKEGALRSAW